MSGMHDSFQANPTTVGRLLAGDSLAVPQFQREYAWREDEVDKLLRDFSRAKRIGPQSYFLGSIVLSAGNPLEVIDGQQRLATSSILLSVVRDFLISLNRDSQAESIELQFLKQTGFEDGQVSSRLTLNVDDRAFFWQAIVCREGSTERNSASPRFESHQRLLSAHKQVESWIGDELDKASNAADKIDILAGWRTFLHEKAIVASLVAKDRRQAFRMFVTLNDRGLQVSQTDLVKNHLFEKAQDSFDSVQSAWTQVRSTLEQLEMDGVSLDYLRHFLAMSKGLVRTEEIFDVVEDNIVTESDSVQFAETLANTANDYAAMLSPSHAKWRGSRLIRNRLTVLNEELKVKFHRALLLAVISHFDEAEILKSLGWLTSVAVRLLVVGGSRSGRTEGLIAAGAKKVADGDVSTASELANEMLGIAPVDIVFRDAFAEKRIDKSRVARYLLRSIEANWREEEYPETRVVEDTGVVNLEHILPKKFPTETSDWAHFNIDEHRVYAKRIGNMVLMRSSDNSSLGQAGFAEKRTALEAAVNLKTTLDVVESTTSNSNWTKANIEARQSRLADTALEVWPITV